MEMIPSSIQNMVKKVKEEMFSSSFDVYSFVSPSAYDTAWLAMIPNPQQLDRPMFLQCLDWVLNNQNENGFWGECDGRGVPTISCLPATLACMVALRKWNGGSDNIEKGLAFIRVNAEKLLTELQDPCPRWFAIVFPAMVELAHRTDLEVIFSDGSKKMLKEIFNERQRILEKEKLLDQHRYPPLISYLEALPRSYDIDQEEILRHLSKDGSLFQSPSATSQAVMATGNRECMMYLESLVQRCGYQAPPIYPMDEELVKLCIVNQLESLGLAEHFPEEIQDILTHVYRKYVNKESKTVGIEVLPTQIYKDSLAFRLLRMHGYRISPWIFCWFLGHQDIQNHLEENYECFLSPMFNVYKATELMFSGEHELVEARSLSRKSLEKAMMLNHIQSNFGRLIKHELGLPWLARLDHLEHRMCIEEYETNSLWMGKASFYRLPCLLNDLLLQLSMENYNFRQSIYKNELEELGRWSKETGLCDMGFGREKTTYCYFAIATSCSLPHYSDIRLIAAKSAIIITVTDDFFDFKGSLYELENLTEAVRRWEGKSLSGHGKVLFDALDNLVSDIAGKYLKQHRLRHGIMKNLRDIWYQTFFSWLTEAKWSKSGYIPSMDEYLETGMTSIATHTIILPAASLTSPALPKDMMRHARYDTLTKLLMVSTRLLNDLQSYKKEKEDGKMNLVMLYLKENPEASIEDSISYIKMILEQKKKELLEHVLVDDIGDMPNSCKQLHLAGLKVFQMFFNSANRFDSDTEMLLDIKKAIYDPLMVEAQGSPSLLSLIPNQKLKKGNLEFNVKKGSLKLNAQFEKMFQHPSRQSFTTCSISKTNLKGWHGGPNAIVSKFTLAII